MKRALIIGVAGQDGALLAELLHTRSIDYLGMDRRGIVSPGGQLVQAGTLADPQFLRDVVRSYRPVQVFYLAAHHHSSQDIAVAGGETSLWNSSLDVQVHGLVHTLDALKSEAPEARLFFASSSHIFGSPADSPQNENTPRAPTNIYGVTKAAGMEVCRYYREQNGLFASIGILYNHESIHRKEKFLSMKVIRAALAIKRGKLKQLVLGNLSAEVDWGYAPDYVDAMLRILDLNHPDTFIVATGEGHTVREFVQIAFEHHGLDYREWVKEDASLVGRPRCRLVGEAGRLRRETGWAPSVSFSEMIQLLSAQVESREREGHE